MNVQDWQQMSSSSNGFARHPFTVADAGFQLSATDVPDDELGFFQLFFTDALFHEMVHQTNVYAQSKLGPLHLRPHSVWNTWKDVTSEEMKAYIGVILNMAVNDRPGVFDYFSRDWLGAMPFFADVFCRSRFLQIHWMFHVAPLSVTKGPVRRASKVGNILTFIRSQCLLNFIPNKHIAIDESTIGFKGRVAFKMYNPQKPTKWGLRVYVLADCDTGYIATFEPYYGRETTQILTRPDLPFTCRIVMHLIEKLLEKSRGSGYHLYTDRYYTGCELACELLKVKVHLTGTVQKNRKGLPAEVKKKMKLKQNEVVAYKSADQIMCLVWQDKRPVLMLSTYHNASTQTIQRRQKTNGVMEEVDIQKPVVIIDYTAKMGAVDRADHLCTSYNFCRKSLKWWRKLFFWLLEVSVVNSYILYNINRDADSEPRVTHLQFRKRLIEQLVGDVRNARKRRGRPSTQDKAERLNQRPHFLGQADKNHAKDCVVCSNRHRQGERKRTVFYCDTCSRHPGLHPTECFRRYHTLVNYKDD